ncbi:hypothetical protein V5O48_013988 [Marasmius crinis-equi]|uniref:Uncharacterized protein n=1 Tax=Marasmius crinis-equi TaxID=585013 RepID=A0ABR3EYX9_9AGAR
MMINTSAEDGIWGLEIVESGLRLFLSPIQQAGMYLLQSIVFLALFINSCDSFNVTIPSNLTAGQPTVFYWNATPSDFDPPNSGVGVGVLVISALYNPQCPKSDFVNSFGSEFFKSVDGRAVVIKPMNMSQQSGMLTLQFKKSGPHIFCAYGKFPQFNPQSRYQNAFGQVVFLNESSQFDVANGTSTSPSATSSTSNSASESTNWNGHGRNNHYDDHSAITKIVGGVVGGIAAICLGAAIFFYRRFRYQRKVNQFHKEHVLLNQQPPPSMSSTLGYPAYNTRITSPPPGTVESPTSPPTIGPLGSHIPLGFNETMQESYHFPSVGSSPSSFPVPLPNDPVLKAQRTPGAVTNPPVG